MSYFDNLRDKDEIVFIGMMELGWEIKRWAAPINYFIQNNPNKRYIIATLADRIDLYKGYNEHCSVHIDKLYVHKRPCMYFVQNMNNGEYEGIVERIRKLYPKAFICEPTNNRGRYLFDYSEMDFDFQPRPENKKIINSLLTNKKMITLAPRHRGDNPVVQGINRNWSVDYWHHLYSLLRNYTVFVAGTAGSYIRPNQGLGICLEDYNANGTSTIGLVIEAIKASRLTVGQQSGNPILSLLLGIPVVSWGHEKERHSIEDNPKGTPICFFDDPTYSIKPDIVYQKILEMTQ